MPKIDVRTLLMVSALMLTLAAPLGARQREYVIGTQLDVVGGGDSNPLGFGSASTLAPEKTAAFYSIYPAMNATVTGAGARSVLDLSYAFGFDRTNVTPKLETQSHTGLVAFTRALGTTGSIRFADTLQKTSDQSTFNAFRGVITDPADFNFVFDAVASGISSLDNTASVTVDRDLSLNSSLSYGGSHNMRRYESLEPGLSNQQRFTGNIRYTRNLSTRSSWNVRYAGGFSNFDEFNNTISHTSTLGYSIEMRPNLTFTGGAGPSYVHGTGGTGGYLGWNGVARLQKNIAQNTFALWVLYESGTPSGLGTVSDTRQAGIEWSRGGPGLNVFLDASVFDAQGSLDNPFQTRGISASGSLGYPVTETLSIHGGVRYQKYAETGFYDFKQERAYLTVRFNDPDLWRFVR